MRKNLNLHIQINGTSADRSARARAPDCPENPIGRPSGLLRAGAGAAELEALLAAVWSGRADRGAEERAALADRAPLLAATDLRKDPHLEMHTRGG